MDKEYEYMQLNDEWPHAVHSSDLHLQIQQSERRPLTLSFDDLSYSVKVPGKDSRLDILRDVSGQVKPGELVGLLGPSGCGKSTLLDILADRKSHGVINGSIKVNGVPRDSNFKKLVSYVVQEDHLLPTATVYETLRFYADLRLPTSWTSAEKDNRITSVLKSVLLEGKRDSMVGGVLPGGLNIRALSGGEKRRVTIGCALVTNPSMLFLDEPTSGLDAKAALTILQILKRLTQDQVTVLCSIHQARHEIYDLFSNVIVMLDGRMLYQGSNPVQFFIKQGYPCPPHTNVADYILDSITDLKEKNMVDEIVAVRRKSSAVLDSSLHTTVATVIAHDDSEYVTGFLNQLRVLMGRTYKDFMRNIGNSLFRITVSILVGLIFAAAFGSVPDDQDGVTIRSGLLFFGCLSFFMMPFVSINLFLSKKIIYNQEQGAKLYHPAAYFIAVSFFETVVVFLSATLYALVVWYCCGLRNDAGTFCFAALVLFVTYLTGDFTIIAWAHLTAQSDLTFLVGSTSLFVNMLFAGFFIRVSAMTTPFGWLRWFNPAFYGFSALMINEFEGRTIQCTDPTRGCYFKTGEDVLELFSLTDRTKGQDTGLILIFTAFLAILAYGLMVKLHKEKR
eukprot:GILK01010348.1.p1 GENE.GILK01010348.1~~GILK01010348.1.p1  ORF type:complete len:618 (+),score=86.96 GILK01010348.1:95-1948(+)